jgi:hypothetical protein
MIAINPAQPRMLRIRAAGKKDVTGGDVFEFIKGEL